MPFLDINREIASIRNQRGNNWLAQALEKIQTTVRQQGVQTAAAVQAAQQPPSIGTPTPPVESSNPASQVAAAPTAAKKLAAAPLLLGNNGQPLIDFSDPGHLNKNLNAAVQLIVSLVVVGPSATSQLINTSVANNGGYTRISFSAFISGGAAASTLTIYRGLSSGTQLYQNNLASAAAGALQSVTVLDESPGVGSTTYSAYLTNNGATGNVDAGTILLVLENVRF